MKGNNENWLIIGAGAIGLLWYSKLADLKISVTLLHRSVQKLETLILENNLGAKSYPLKELSNSWLNNGNTAQTFNRILFCTKSFDLINAYKENMAKISPDAQLITLCNGMGSQHQLAEILKPTQTLFIATTSEGALKLAPNKIKRTGEGDIYIGALDHSKRPPQPFSRFYTGDIVKKLYSKLAVNAVINPLTAFFDIKNGQLLNAQYSHFYLACRDEVCHFLVAKGFVQSDLANLIDQVVEKTAQNRSSMLQDFSSQRETEIDYICGFLIAEVDKTELRLPIQSFLLECIKKKLDHTKKLSDLSGLISF
ncbi:hypothetical protein OA92_04365 [Marinomonas sp. SBI22]|uniref:ketopantoate reductase family protein n=1 Tax=unclassified Marinomonas TaxID=196814 RepID=UPI0007AF42F2|nr:MULTISPECIES: 2-dehydropantoate 2-reductase [unclassified Marinomonas]KZM45092.1 hypothetical protein OA92_04365 [Marinomonas sp. SBI22]KZM46790.1 hypothetical protein OA91_03420 [Marinomonas sp. SBI8L]